MIESAKRHDAAGWCAVLMALALWSSPGVAQTDPRGWFKAGSSPADYDVGTDRDRAFSGGSSGYIRSIKPEISGFGTYMQMFDATEYRGKRLRLSAYVRTENVENWAGLWMRVDGDSKPVAFDNMFNRPIKGTQDWKYHAVVLDVDANAKAVAFGILLNGRGAVWIDDVSLETVGTEVPVTSAWTTLPDNPRNLDFETGPEVR
jgi:hypothetical protein